MSREDFSVTIGGHDLEYIDEEHIYLVDGQLVPSITEIVRSAEPDKYKAVAPDVLARAAEKGTAVHKAIEEYVTEGFECDLPELRGFKFLQKHYRFKPVRAEVPVILFRRCRENSTDEPIAAGRLDLVLENTDGLLGLADIKRTSALDKNYLAYQLNLYRLAYEQTYGGQIDFLAGLHLREDVRKYVPIPLVPMLAVELIDKYFNVLEGKNE